MTDGGKIKINRVPVLTLWAAVLAERLGFDRVTGSPWARRWSGSCRS
jgi:hypothetical protein